MSFGHNAMCVDKYQILYVLFSENTPYYTYYTYYILNVLKRTTQFTKFFLYIIIDRRSLLVEINIKSSPVSLSCLSSDVYHLPIESLTCPPPGSGVLIIYVVVVPDTASTVPTQIENIPRGVVQPSRYCFIITFTKYLKRYEQQRKNKLWNVAPIVFDDYCTLI